MARVLDLGCGQNKYPGAIGVDSNPRSAADVLCDLDHPPYPFADNSFDEVRAVHVVEHTENVIQFMEEVHRLLRPGGRLYLVTPHHSDTSSFTDPTHRWHLTSQSFTYFTGREDYGFYSTARFREIEVRLKLLRLWRCLAFELLVNHSRLFRKFCEQYLCFVLRGKVMEFWFEALKAEARPSPPA